MKKPSLLLALMGLYLYCPAEGISGPFPDRDAESLSMGGARLAAESLRPLFGADDSLLNLSAFVSIDYLQPEWLTWGIGAVVPMGKAGCLSLRYAGSGGYGALSTAALDWFSPDWRGLRVSVGLALGVLPALRSRVSSSSVQTNASLPSLAGTESTGDKALRDQWILSYRITPQLRGICLLSGLISRNGFLCLTGLEWTPPEGLRFLLELDLASRRPVLVHFGTEYPIRLSRGLALSLSGGLRYPYPELGGGLGLQWRGLHLKASALIHPSLPPGLAIGVGWAPPRRKTSSDYLKNTR